MPVDGGDGVALRILGRSFDRGVPLVAAVSGVPDFEEVLLWVLWNNRHGNRWSHSHCRWTAKL